MKKICLLILPFILSGCIFEKENEVKPEKKVEKEPIIEKEEYIDDNPIKLGDRKSVV